MNSPPSSRAPRLLIALALAASCVGLGHTLYAAWQQDWTYDEPYHMQWARRLLLERVSERKSDPLWNSKTPIMIPYVLAKDAGRALGATDGRALSFWARMPGALCFAVVLSATFLFARRRLGEATGALAVLCLALDPNLIAHSAVATVDAPYTLATLLTLMAAVRYSERPTHARALAIGLALGFAFATKFTAFLLIPGLLLLPLCYGVARLGGWRRLLVACALVAVVAITIVSAAYLFVAFARPLSTIPWKSALMTRVAAALPGLRLPLPADFLTGLDICLAHERGRAWSVLILGGKYADGVWWYFLVSWALKTPLLLAAAQVAGCLRLARQRLVGEQRPLVIFLALNLLLGLCYFSFLFRAQIGYRYVLMCLPLVALLAARGWSDVRSARLGWGAVIVGLAAAFELLPYAGNALAFTSPLVQPKTETFRYLTNSSVDWGQNDERVQAWLPEERARRAGQTVLWEPSHIRPGVNVIGLNSLAGGGNYNQHRWLREHMNPEGHFRYTYLWFTIDAPTYERFLDEDRRLSSRAEDQTACAQRPAPRAIELDTWRAFPENPGRSNAWIVCVETDSGTDLAILGQKAGLLLGRAGAQMRDWDVLRSGEELVYRLDPGVHALAVIKTQLFAGRIELRRGTARLSMQPAVLRKGGRFELYEGPAGVTEEAQVE